MKTINNNEKYVRVTDITWERAFLDLKVETNIAEDLAFSLERIKRKRQFAVKGQIKDSFIATNIVGVVPLKAKRSGDTYHIDMNITIANGTTFLDNGTWRLVAEADGEKMNCSVDYDLIRRFDDKSRTFKYSSTKQYNMFFDTYSETGEDNVFCVKSYFLRVNNNWMKPEELSNRVTLKGKAQLVNTRVKQHMMRAAYKVIYDLTPDKEKNVMFMSETKPYIWGNLKYISDRMIERGLDKEFNITYNTRRSVGTNSPAKSWFTVVSKLAKQGTVFVDDYVPLFGFLDLGDKTTLIQVWHAGEGFKAVGYCRFGKRGGPGPQSSHRKYDYAIAGSKRLSRIYSEVFGIPEERVLPLGMARLDGYLDEDRIAEYRKNFYAEHPELEGKKIIIFAPTFRGTGQKVAYYDYDRLDLKEIYDFCGDEYVWAFKMHPFVREAPPIPEEYKDRILDMSSEENINDLYYVTEILITDYSSAYFEFSLFEKPIIFFTYDRDNYETIRGVHKSVKETAPGKVCDSFDEMMTALREKDYDIERTKAFHDENFGDYDGHAADRIIDKFLLKEDVK